MRLLVGGRDRLTAGAMNGKTVTRIYRLVNTPAAKWNTMEHR
jgi:hypothetical protein